MSPRHFARFVSRSIFCTVIAISLLSDLAQGQAPTITPTTVYAFAGVPGPENPNDQTITQGRDGELYFWAAGGDNSAQDCSTAYCGGLFKISTTGTVTDLFDMSNQGSFFTGNGAYGGLALGTDGNFYGATRYGSTNGSTNNGTIFKMTSTGAVTPLYNFTGGSDGSHPYAAPVQATNGTFYGTTDSESLNSTAYSITSSGTFKTLHTFTGSDGQAIYAPLVQGTDGNFYGTASAGGTSNDGVIFKMTSSGTVTVLHNFTGTDGSSPYYPLIQGSDGSFYGATYNGGTSGAGVIFKITSTGAYTVLHNLNGTTDGQNPAYALVQATNGKLYGVTAGSNISGTIYSITTSGTFTTLYTFTGGTDGNYPLSPMVQHTDGLLYGTTYIGGNVNGCSTNINQAIYLGCGTVFSYNIGAKAFLRLQTTSGTVGSKVSMFGQGFSSSSVVKFNGVAAAAPTLSGTTYLTATVPAGASNGFVTVTTGSSTLTSTQKYTVHNSWSTGAAIPTPVFGAAAGAISGKIYVVSGDETYLGVPVNNNQVYNPTTNSWSTAAAIPTPVFGAASAVVSGSLYVIGGYEGTSGTPTNLVQIYNPTTNAWTTGATMPTARGSDAAAVDGTSIYVIGGNGSTDRLTTVEKYVPSTNTWTEEAPLLTGVSEATAGLEGSSIVAADGYTSSGDQGTTEEYDVSTNAWSSLNSDPTARNISCYGAISGILYVAGGVNNNPTTLTLNESFKASTNKWTTLLAMPTAADWQASAVNSGLLYCFGGQATFQGAATNNVQIYQP